MFDEQRVLIADGDERLRRKLYGLLLDREIFSDCVSEAGGAVAKVRGEDYALVLLDLALPPNGADDVLAVVSKMPPGRRPFILALATHQDTRNLDVDIVQIVLRKPFDTSAAADIVQSCMRSALRREARARVTDTDYGGDGDGSSATA